MEINLKMENDELKVGYENVPDLDSVMMMLCGAIDASVSQVTGKLDEDQKADLFERLTGLFDYLLNKMFPEFIECDFDMTDAALVYAQDQIINDAFENGKTLEEALKEYEDKAREYIAKRRAKES